MNKTETNQAPWHAYLLDEDVEGFNAWREAHPDAEISLIGGDLRGLDLQGVLLAGAELDGCRFDDAALSHAILSGASLQGAVFHRADLCEAQLGPARLSQPLFMGTRLGYALLNAADLGGASLQGARLDGASFAECDLTRADLREANMVAADFNRACLDNARQAPPPPTAQDDFDEIRAWLGREQPAARDGFILFAALTAQLGGADPESVEVVTSVASALGYDQARFNACLPQGAVHLSDLKVTPLASQWLRRVLFELICGLGSPTETCVSAIMHFGAQWGFGDVGMARIIGEVMGVTLGDDDDDDDDDDNDDDDDDEI
ncbi:pentapeptide repeat-containing protein [Myxococcota bacterium]|nr:pentapeptide repeat-containing protein [Myxococcota bacterium]MBU1896857.1 pentapeptide repeat-containing protein [Myxococcota bacterium]